MHKKTKHILFDLDFDIKHKKSNKNLSHFDFDLMHTESKNILFDFDFDFHFDLDFRAFGIGASKVMPSLLCRPMS